MAIRAPDGANKDRHIVLRSLITNTAHASEAQVVTSQVAQSCTKTKPSRCLTSEQSENKTKQINRDANYQHTHIKHQVHLIGPKRLKTEGNERREQTD